MTYNQSFNQQQAYPSMLSNPSVMFQPGYAGTNVQEVQQQNQSFQNQNFQNQNFQNQNIARSSPALTYGYSNAGVYGAAQAMFQPGFAGTNAMEVRQQNNAVYPQQQFLGYSQQHQPLTQSSFSGQVGIGSIFSPGFAGTNVQEVQARNQPGISMGLGSFGASGYSQQQGQPGISSAPFQQGYNQLQQQAYRPQQQFPSYASPLGTGVQAIFNPGFAGTNVQEVRALNAEQSPSQAASIFPGSY